MGRFINRDTIGEAGGINLYGYVGNNPVSYTDPEGTFAQVLLTPQGIAILAMAATGITWGASEANKWIQKNYGLFDVSAMSNILSRPPGSKCEKQFHDDADKAWKNYLKNLMCLKGQDQAGQDFRDEMLRAWTSYEMCVFSAWWVTLTLEQQNNWIFPPPSHP